MPIVKVLNAGKNVSEEITLNNGDLILIFKGSEIINQLMISSYKGEDAGCRYREYCNAMQLKSGLSYKSSPLRRKNNTKDLRAFLFNDYTIYRNCYDFRIIKRNNYEININIKEVL